MQRALALIVSTLLLAPLLAGCLLGESESPRTRRVLGDGRPAIPQQVERGTKQNLYPPKKITDRLTQDHTIGPSAPPAARPAPGARRRLAARLPVTEDRLPQQPGPTSPLAPQADLPPLSEPDRTGLALGQFYQALEGLESGRRRHRITILHLGDSHIAADRFSGDLRRLFQKRFGNAGRGMVMPGDPFGYSHSRGVRTSNEGEWKIANSQRGHPGTYGLTGVSLTSSDPQAALTLQRAGRGFGQAEVTLLTGPGMGRALVETGRERNTVNLKAARTGLRRVVFKRPSRLLRVRPAGEDPVTLLSWAVGNNQPGIRYINLGIPGASLLTTRKWNRALVANQIRHLKPDLIILGYGTNEGFNDKLDLAAYQRYYQQFVARLRGAAPRASFLIIGPPDGARLPRFADRQGAGCKPLSRREISTYAADISAGDERLARWHAPPKLDAVRNSLKRIASRVRAKFWDWSKVMGKNCGIHRWANASPKKAVRDHVHLTSLGAKTSAQLLFKDLMNQYVSHKRLVRRSQ